TKAWPAVSGRRRAIGWSCAAAPLSCCTIPPLATRIFCRWKAATATPTAGSNSANSGCRAIFPNRSSSPRSVQFRRIALQQPHAQDQPCQGDKPASRQNDQPDDNAQDQSDYAVVVHPVPPRKLSAVSRKPSAISRKLSGFLVN